MTNSTMTMRDFLNGVIEAEVSEAITEKAKAELAKLDARNEKRASTMSKVAKANIPLIADLEAYLKDNGPMIASEIAEDLRMTSNKVASLAKASEKIVVAKTRVKGREVNIYSLSADAE